MEQTALQPHSAALCTTTTQHSLRITYYLYEARVDTTTPTWVSKLDKNTLVHHPTWSQGRGVYTAKSLNLHHHHHHLSTCRHQQPDARCRTQDISSHTRPQIKTIHQLWLCIPRHFGTVPSYSYIDKKRSWCGFCESKEDFPPVGKISRETQPIILKAWRLLQWKPTVFKNSVTKQGSLNCNQQWSPEEYSLSVVAE